MDKYHVCYLLGKELCTGLNVFASNYKEAITKFEQMMPNKCIVYITRLV